MSQDNKKEVHLQPDLPEQGIGFAHRRQVIRGLASIPVALTLSNGAAASGASSHMCLTNETSTPPSCTSSTNNSIPGWASNVIDPPDDWAHLSPAPTSKRCVPYATQDSSGNINITGYNYTYNGSSKFIDADGVTVPGGMSGNPLTASCATSFV